MFKAVRPLLLILAITFGLPAQAQDEARDPPSERETAGDRVRQVERDGGRVLQAEPMQRRGREVYRLKVLTPEGRVRVLDDSRRRESGPDAFERRGDDGATRAMPMPRERRYRQSEGRGEPAPQLNDGPRPEAGRGDRGERSPT
ncbi:MAG: hypothetical protein K0M70_01605 [Arenimonas sp.]|uniref:hypothetical protein n=1 Tax=Arenimonas sp. TaxID=1872635 RepID=UPI0025C1108D|nr:hypothetical protein [Arenimonas sp.]MBW8366544.1 hypothetical protein [Arenimonas sp.]